MKSDKFFDHITIYHDILSEKERIYFLRECKPLLQKMIPYGDGEKTDSNLHLVSKKTYNIHQILKKIHKKSKITQNIKRSWVNYTDADYAYESWHHHNFPGVYELSCIFMIENPENLGTWFKYDDVVYKLDCPTNSMCLFPKSLLHTVPPNVKKPRYSLAIDFEDKKINYQYE